MSYIALYRKYRPLDFNDVVGQEKTVTILKSMIENNKIANGYLLCGGRGLGKTTLAKIFGKAVNCEGDEIPCNNCPRCNAVNENKSMDVIELDAASNRGVDTVREKIINKVNFKPQGKYKVFILDEVHMFTNEAWNALLKTLEEPPSYCIFILCTTNPEKIPKTILSRVQRFDLKDMSNDDIVNRLKYICGKENIKYEEEALYAIARYAKGGMRDSISALDQMSSFDGTVTVDNVSEILGLISDDICIDILSNLEKDDFQSNVKIVDDIINGGKSIDDLFDSLTKVVRALTKLDVGVDISKGFSNADLSENILNRLKVFTGKFNMLGMMRTVIDSERDVKYASDKQLAMLTLLSKLNNTPSLPNASGNANIDLSDIYNRLKKLEELVDGDYISNKSDVKNTISNIKKLVSKEEDDSPVVPNIESDSMLGLILKWTKGKVK